VTKKLRLRQAVRAVVLDQANRILLVRFEFPDGSVWALPGGGKEPGEDDLATLRREMAEEIGLVDFVAVGPIWERTDIFQDPVVYDGQFERIYLIQTGAFAPVPTMTWDELNAEGMVEIRWWDVPALPDCLVPLTPVRLATLVAELIDQGPPREVVDVGP
jgi:8-oxo-dGTP pyrophosphatase MutT (NUDIX family)